MTDQQLIDALQSLSVETGSLACLGCGHEHNCSLQGCRILREAVAAIQRQPRMRWIPVTERLPEKNDQWVLCLCVSGAIEVLKFDYTMWNWDAQYPGRCYMENYVTHWMPLPEPPKGE